MSEENLEIVNDILDLECDYKELDTDDDGTFEGLYFINPPVPEFTSP